MKKNLNEQLEHLLSTKSFGELTAEERYFVTETLSETEYERMYFLVKNAPPILKDTPPPSSAIRENLMAAMRSQKSKPKEARRNVIVRLLRARIPAWQAAATVALLLGLHFLLKPEPVVVENTLTKYVHSVDTVYKEVAMPAIKKTSPKVPARINVKPRELPQPKAESLVQSTAPLQATTRTELPDTFALTVSQPRGQSATQTEDLWQFLGKVH